MMDYSKLLHDYVDGTIDPAQEDNLFIALAANDGLREDLRHFIDFELSARNDVEAFTPTAESTEAVFSRLNIPPTVTEPSGFSAFFHKASVSIVSSAVTALVAIVSMYFIMQTGGGGSDEIMASEFDNNIQAPAFTMNIPVMDSRQKEDEPSQPQIKYIVRYVERPSEDMEVNSMTASGEENISLPDIHASRPDLSGFNPETLHKNSLGTIDNICSGEKIFSEIFYSHSKIGLNLEISGADYESFPKATLRHSSNPLFSNTAVKCMYQISKEFSAGIDFRQEFFFQQYDGSENGQEFIYEQHTNYQTLVLAARYAPVFSRYGIIQPFVEAGLGMNKAGPVGRIMLGTEIMVYDNYGFILGVEGSALGFHHGNQNYLAKKIGFHYGVKMKF